MEFCQRALQQLWSSEQLARSCSPVVVRLRHRRRSGEFEAGRTERAGKEAPPEGPPGDGWMPCRAALLAYSPEPADRVAEPTGYMKTSLPTAALAVPI